MVLRGQGDSLVRICEACKQLEEAARLEQRYGYNNRTVKGIDSFFMLFASWTYSWLKFLLFANVVWHLLFKCLCPLPFFTVGR